MKAEVSKAGRLTIPGSARGGSLVVPGRTGGVNRWLLAAALLLLAAAAYAGYTRLSQTAASPPKLQTVEVTKGTVAATVTSTGSVAARTTAQLAFRTSGRVEQVAVSVGDQVKQGQLLAKLEDADLKTQVVLAQAQLTTAQAKLDGLKAGARPEEVASAAAALASAQAKLSQVQKGSTQADLQSAESAVVTARGNLASAEAKLADLKRGPTPEDLAIAQTAVDQARAGLASAQAKLDELKAGPTQSDIASAQASVNSAKQALITAEDKYQMAKGDNLKESGFSSVSAAQQNYESARANYDTAVQKLNELMAGSKAADLQAAQSNVDSAGAALTSAEARLAQVKAGQTQADLVQAEKAVDSARSALTSAEAKLEQLKAGATPEDLDVAQAAVTQAQATLALKRSPNTEADLRTAEAAVQQAEASLEQARRNLENASLFAPFDGVVAAVSASPGETATGAVVTLVDPKQVRVNVNLAEMDVARVQLGQGAEIAFDALQGARLTGKVVAIAPSATVQSGVATYQVSLSVGELIRQQTTTTGAGRVVGSAQPGQGSRPAPTTAVSPSSVPRASDGSAFQDQPQAVKDLFTSTYGEDAARLWVQQRNSDLIRQALKPGMTASATIFYAQKADVLAIPNKAIKMQGRDRVVDVLVNGAPEARVVRVGLSGDQMTEIVEGLAEGEQVVIPGTATTTTSTSSTRAPGAPGFGGGFPGVPGGAPPR